MTKHIGLIQARSDRHIDHHDVDDDDIVEDEDEQVVESGNARRRGSITHTHSQNQHPAFDLSLLPR